MRIARLGASVVTAAVLAASLLGAAAPAQAATDDLYAWGEGTNGAVGNGVKANASTPTRVSTLPQGVSLSGVVAGVANFCGLSPVGAAYCWGLGNFGLLGDGGGTGTRSSATVTPVVMPVGVTFASLTAARLTMCGLTSAGVAYCWGRGQDGELGNGALVDSDVPVPVTMPEGVTFTKLTANRGTFCGLTGAGNAYCWGANWLGQAGNGTTSPVTVPTPVTMPGGVTFTSLLPLFYATCALTPIGTAYCWGGVDYGTTGVIGNGTDGGSTVPAAVTMPTGVTFAALYANMEGFTPCALTSAGVAYCWGEGRKGQLGNGGFTNVNVPTAVTMPTGVTFASITQGSYHTCAIARVTAAAYCWGYNDSGQVGIGTGGADANVSVPTAISAPAGVKFAGLASLWYTTCGWTTVGTVYCWGANYIGQAGGGVVETDVLTPTAALMPPGEPVSRIISTPTTFLAFSEPLVAPPGTPGAPVATSANGRAIVRVVAGSGGAPTSYRVTATPGTRGCTVMSPAVSCVVTGLANGTSYRFRATATNAGGTSSASPLSNSVVPKASQLPANACVTAGSGSSIPRAGWKTLMLPGCATTAGRRVMARVTATTMAGAKRSVTVVCVVDGTRVAPVAVGSGYVRCARGVLKIAPTNAARRITVRWYAPGAEALRAYSRVKTYTT